MSAERVLELEAELARVRAAYARLESECVALRQDVQGQRLEDPVSLTRLELEQGRELNTFRIRDADLVAELELARRVTRAAAFWAHDNLGRDICEHYEKSILDASRAYELQYPNADLAAMLARSKGRRR